MMPNSAARPPLTAVHDLGGGCYGNDIPLAGHAIKGAVLIEILPVSEGVGNNFRRFHRKFHFAREKK